MGVLRGFFEEVMAEGREVLGLHMGLRSRFVVHVCCA